MVEGWGICLRDTETFVWPPPPPLVIQKILIRLRFDLIEYKALPNAKLLTIMFLAIRPSEVSGRNRKIYLQFAFIYETLTLPSQR